GCTNRRGLDRYYLSRCPRRSENQPFYAQLAEEWSRPLTGWGPSDVSNRPDALYGGNRYKDRSGAARVWPPKSSVRREAAAPFSATTAHLHGGAMPQIPRDCSGSLTPAAWRRHRTPLASTVHAENASRSGAPSSRDQGRHQLFPRLARW